MSAIAPLDRKERRKRKREAIAIVLLGVLFVVLTVAEFRLTKLSATLPFVTSIFFFGLLNINLILLIALVWLVFRNIGKVFLERRRNILGSRLKSKLVVAFLAFSIIPTILLFIISALYINSSFDKWFSLRVQNTIQTSLDITRIYYRNTEQVAMHFAEHLALGIGKRMTEPAQPLAPATAWLGDFLKAQRDLLALDGVEFYPDPWEERLTIQRSQLREVPGLYPRLPLEALERAFSGERTPLIQHIGSGDLIRCLVPVRSEGASEGPVVGVVAVNSYIPVSLVNKVDEIASVLDDYKEANPLKYPIKTTYLVILVLITLVILFVAIWIGLFMARQLTVPLERLVHGAQAVGAGNLDIKIQSSGQDEIAVLIDSFNHMTADLRENRARLQEASSDLEKRRVQLEAILANIGTGVISVDSRGRLATVNLAASRILGIQPENALGQPYGQILSGDLLALSELIDRALLGTSGAQAGAPGSVESTQWTFRGDEASKVLTAVATPLRETGTAWGIVAVIDDISHLVKGQREMAWREVARRIAHEIKNPLTPIKLSAQRLQRRMGDYRGRDGALLQECTETIIKHTDELKEMVNEFSNFARFPEISPASNDLNEAVAEVVRLFEPGHPEVKFKTEFEARFPTFEFDRDQIKRVLINLLDNAIAAHSGRAGGATKAATVTVATHYNEQLKIAVLEVADNGPGMAEEVKDRVFEPYFSTKKEGTGLGLAIVKRIVNDHDGFIRVYTALGEGTRFLIELPTSPRTLMKG